MAGDPFDNESIRKAIIRAAPTAIILIAFPIIYSLIKVTSAVLAGNLSKATAFGGVLSGLGTIGLFILTAWYAAETRRMASETEKSRKQERERRKQEEEKELNSLRRALLNEINKIRYFDELAENYGVGTSSLSFVAPTVVYEENAGKVGLLTEKEVDAIVEFYTRVYQIEDLLEFQKEHDSPVGKDAVSRYFLTTMIWMEETLRKVTFGIVSPDNRDKRTKAIKKRLRKLDVVQEKAIQELESALEKNSEGVNKRTTGVSNRERLDNN